MGHERLDSFTCTESDAGPVLDLVWGGLNVLGALVVAANAEGYADPGATVAIGLAWGGVSGTAGIVGLEKSRQCRAAMLLLAQRKPPGAPLRPGGAFDVSTVQKVVVTSAEDTVPVGESIQLVAAAYHWSGVSVPSVGFRWSSSNDAIAAVSNAGLVTAHAPGTVVIAANASNVVGIATIVVIPRRQ